jgi:hypothetical protein
MDDAINNWMQWVENTNLAISIRQSMWLYPGLETLHILGIVLLVGPAFMFDLRLLGFSRKLPVRGLAHHLLPWSWRGLVLVIPSGILLFITNASVLIADATFWLKMLLLGVAGINVALFHKITFPSVAEWNKQTPVPVAAKVAAVFSLLVWIGIITCGRWLAY